MSQQAITEVGEMEDRRCKALTEENYDALEALFADDLVYTHSNALLDTKESLLHNLRSKVFAYKQIDRSNIQMRVHGEAVFVTGQAVIKAAVNGNPAGAHIRYSNVWIKTPKGWQFALWQATPVLASTK